MMKDDIIIWTKNFINKDLICLLIENIFYRGSEELKTKDYIFL